MIPAYNQRNNIIIDDQGETPFHCGRTFNLRAQILYRLYRGHLSLQEAYDMLCNEEAKKTIKVLEKKETYEKDV